MAEAKGERVTRHDLRHDRHTVSLLTDHLVFSPKYRGKVLLGEVAEAAEEIIRENCKERDIDVIDMAVGVDHVHLFIKNPFRKKRLRKNASLSAEVFGKLDSKAAKGEK
jgi:REP element-mobilizing transposase RayT